MSSFLWSSHRPNLELHCLSPILLLIHHNSYYLPRVWHTWKKKPIFLWKNFFRCIRFLICQEADREWWHISVLLQKKQEYTATHNSRIIFFSVVVIFLLCINYSIPMIWIFGYLQSYRLLLIPTQVFMHQGLSWVGSVLNTVFGQRR